MSREVHRSSGLGQREFVAQQRADVEPAGEDQSRDLLLEGEIRRIAAQNVLFIHANGSGIEGELVAALGMREQKELSAAPQAGQRVQSGGVRGDANDGGVEGAVERSGRRARDGAPHLLRPTRPKFFGEAEAVGQQIGGEHTRTSQLQETGEHKANRALARDEDAVTRLEVETADGLQNGIYRFKHGAFREAVGGGDFHHAGQDERQHADVFGVATTGGFKTGGNAGAFVLRALSKGVMATVMAIEARHVMVQRDAVAEAKPADARAHFYDGAGGFVTKYARRRDGAVFDFLDVRGANAANGDANEQFLRADARNGEGFEAKVIRAAIDDGGHGFGDVEHGRVLAAEARG